MKDTIKWLKIRLFTVDNKPTLVTAIVEFTLLQNLRTISIYPF